MGGTYPICSPEGQDEFDGESLGLQWQWNANPKDNWYHMDTEKKELVLHAVEKEAETITNVPNLLLQKWFMPECHAVTNLKLSGMKTGDTAGMISMGVTFGAVAVTKTEDGFVLKQICGEQKFANETATAEDEVTEIKFLSADTKEIWFSNIVKKVPSTKMNSDGPYTFPIPAEDIALGFSLDGEQFEEVLSYPAKAGRWVGVKHGVFCYHENDGEGGQVGVEYFHYL